MLYAQTEQGTWIRAGLDLYQKPGSELGRVGTLATAVGEAIRFDVRSSERTTFEVTRSRRVSGVVRQVFTTVCQPKAWQCLEIMTGCEAYVRGKIYWSFHTELVWHSSLGLRMKGDRRLAGGICKPDAAFIVEEE